MLAQSRGRGGRGTGGRCAALLAALAATSLLAGCGGGNKTPTKASFVTKANAICASLEQQLKELSNVRVQGGFEAKLEEGADTVAKSVAELRKIPLPPHETVPREWLHYRELAAQAAKRLISVAPTSPLRRVASEEEANAKQRANAVARSYGLTDCLST
jgi:outer membrane murein-binding lipoprotein Lpp